MVVFQKGTGVKTMTKENKIEFISRLYAKMVNANSKREEAMSRWHETKKETDYDDVIWFNAQRVILRNMIDELYTEIADEITKKGE